MVILSSTIPTCELPYVLQVIYFFKLIFDIVKVLLPICLIILVMVDFFKCLVTGNENEQKNTSKLALKRIMYAIVVYAIPYVVSLVVGILGNLIPDYNLCITNATKENIDIYVKKYEEAKKLEEEKNKIQVNEMNSVNTIVNNNISSFVSVEDNLLQYDSKWKNAKLCNGSSTMGGAGCGYVAYTMIVRAFGNGKVIPTDIVANAKSKCNSTDGAASIYLLTCSNLNNYYGIKSRVVADLHWNSPTIDGTKKYVNDVKQGLKNGEKFIILIPGHYISILGINNNDTLIVRDSAADFASDGKYTAEELFDVTKNFRVNYRKDKRDCRELRECGWSIIIAYSKK